MERINEDAMTRRSKKKGEPGLPQEPATARRPAGIQAMDRKLYTEIRHAIRRLGLAHAGG